MVDVLDDFSSTKITDTKPTQPEPSEATKPTTSGPGRPEVDTKAGASTTEEEDFSKQLQAGFAEMLKDLESNSDMAKQFEELMSQFGGAPPGAMPGMPSAAPAATPLSASKAAPSPPQAQAQAQQPSAKPSESASKPGEENFQDTIRRTMERMKASDSSASTAQPSSSEDDMMANLLKQLASANEGGEGDDTFSNMLLGMMEQLTNKEILYEPMKELDTKFPDWMEKNGATLNKEDKERYETQKKLVREIVARFEKPGYSDAKTDDREYIVDRMQKVRIVDSLGWTKTANGIANRCKPLALLHRISLAM